MLILNFLDASYKLYLTKNIFLPEKIILENVVYSIDNESKENNGFIGFFDWLRRDKSNIVGIRLAFFEHHMYNKIFSHLPYLSASLDNKYFELIFDGEKYEPHHSADQDFNDNYVYKSKKGEYLFTFSLDHLTREELNSLERHCHILGPHDLERNS